jgi:hypothetical protein
MTKSEIEVKLAELSITMEYIKAKLDEISLSLKGVVTREMYDEHLKENGALKANVDALHTRVDAIEGHLKVNKAKYSWLVWAGLIAAGALINGIVSFFFSNLMLPIVSNLK